MDISWILFLFSIQFTVQCLCYSLSLSRNKDSDNRLDIDEEGDRDSRDSRERSDWRRPDSNTYQDDDETARFKGWNYVDTSKEWTPHKKTISLQVLDDHPYYHGGRPSWPHDEYLYNSFYGNYNRNGTDNNGSRPNDLANSAYEWQRLPYRYSSYYGYPYQNPQSVTDSSSSTNNNKLETTDAQGTTSISDKRHHPYVYGNSWYSPYFGNEYRGGGGRRRFRLQIHPGLIAAPLAGIAAYKAASAFNPLLVELGIIDKGHGHGSGHGWGSYPSYPGNYPSYPPPIAPPIVPPIPSYPSYPSYPPPYRPPIGPTGGTQTPYPILIPSRHQESEKSSWWNPFSVLTPRN